MTANRDTLHPDAQTVADVRATIESRLVSSLRYLVEELEPLPSDIAAACRERLLRLTPDRIDPALHGLHAQMRNAALNGDRIAYDTTRHLFAQWTLDRSPRTDNGTPAILSLTENDYDPIRSRILAAGFADDVGLTTQLVPPPGDVLTQETPSLRRALRLIADFAPDWSAEVSQLVSEIILATNSSMVPDRNFAGGSVFDLFGALLVNPAHRSDIAHYLMTIIHESSHLRLFCYHLDDEVVLNDDVARYHSPLRRQPRPMEGVFHAMWVSARMAVFGRDLLERVSGRDVLSVHETSQMRDQVRAATVAFHDGRGVVEEHGKLTELGRQLLDDATRAVGTVS